MDNTDLIKLPMPLGIEINNILKSKMDFVPRKNSIGILSLEFTKEELELIDKLKFESPTSGLLDGIELLPNLKSLVISTPSGDLFTQEKNMASISDKDILKISKCSNLRVLEIINQHKISYLDVSNLKNLKGLLIANNYNLEEVEGLEELKDLWTLDCIGNETLSKIKDLDKIIESNEELDSLNLDVLLYPDAIGYNNGFENTNVIEKLNRINTSWQEKLTNSKNIKINNYQMRLMHEKAVNACDEYMPNDFNKYTCVLGAELFLAENVKYDHKSIKHSNHTHSSNGIAAGPIGGTNGAYNAFMYNTCVCEGYTRAMQYMLRLKNIKTRNVHCIAGEDKLHMSTDNGNDIYKRYELPDDGYHSIVCIEDLNYLYDDPCWNSINFQKGDDSFKYTLLTKNEISKTHTLSFGETKVDNDTSVVPRDTVITAINQIIKHNKKTNVDIKKLARNYYKNGYVSALIVTLITGFAGGVIATVLYYFVNK